MNCTNCGSATTPSATGFCGDCGPAGPAEFRYETPPVSPAVGYVQYGATAGYGVDEGGLPDGPIAGRSYGGAPVQLTTVGAIQLEEAPVTAPPAQLAEEPVTAPPTTGYADGPALYGTARVVPNRLSVVALVLAGLAVLVMPVGLVALIFASTARAQGEPLGPRSFTVSVATTLAGAAVAVAAFALAVH